MKHGTSIVPDGECNNLSSIVGAYKILTRADEHWRKLGRKQEFRVELAGISETVAFHEGLFTVKPHRHISAITKTDLIIVPSLNHDYRKVVARNGILIDWLEKRYREGAEIATICTHTFLYASVG